MFPILVLLIFIIRKTKYFNEIKSDLVKNNLKNKHKKEILNSISPFHLLLYFLITHLIWLILWLDNPKFFYTMIFLYVIYSITYYKTLSQEKKYPY